MIRQVISKTAQGAFGQSIQIGNHRLNGDKPIEVGGNDKGPSPFEYLLTALATCVSMTVKMYCDRKQWPLRSITVVAEGTEADENFKIQIAMNLEGDLDGEQRERCLTIAHKCPVHKALLGKTTIEVNQTC